MKAWLSRAGIRFDALDVMTDDDAYGALLALGFRRVPVTIIGDLVVQGYDPEALAFHTRHFKIDAETAARRDAPSE